MPTHKTKPKTYQRMLPQSSALESCLISSTDDKDKKTADSVHCRGERADESLSRNHTAMCETDQVTDPRVFVLAKKKTPLMPCHPARARELLSKGKAAVMKLMPFALRLRNRIAGTTQPIKLKIDPGAKTTGISIQTQKRIQFLAEVIHRKAIIIKKLKQRRAYRRRRRSTNLRCREPRFLNRGKKGFIAPSMQSILNNIQSWVSRLRRWAPITELVIETAKFDAQKLQNPEISGVEYQQGTLQGYQLKEYLLEKFKRTCFYCKAKNLPLEVEHVIPKSQGGSNHVNNLTLSCTPCNQEKASQSIIEFLGEDSAKLKSLQSNLKKPLACCATMNTLRNRLRTVANATGLPVHESTGAETKCNRKKFGIPKTHSLDAAFTGYMETCPKGTSMKPLLIKAAGRGSYQRTRTDKFGFPRLYLPKTKMVEGFQSGDIVKTPKGKGRIAVRKSGHFALNTPKGNLTIKHNQCKIIQRADGYNYSPPQSLA